MEHEQDGQILLAKEFEQIGENQLEEEMRCKYFKKAAHVFELAKCWERAAIIYINLANYLMGLGDFSYSGPAAELYVNASRCYKELKLVNDSILCLQQAGDLYIQWKERYMAAYTYKKVAVLYENDQNLEKAIEFYEKAAENYKWLSHHAKICWEKVAQIAAELTLYDKAIFIYEKMAKESLNHEVLKYGVSGHILDIGVCMLCKGNIIEILDLLQQYQAKDPPFSKTREYKFLVGMAASLYRIDIAGFTSVLEQYEKWTPLVQSKKKLLLRVKENLKVRSREQGYN